MRRASTAYRHHLALGPPAYSACGMIGKTHLATALGYAACQHGYSVLFANAIDAINILSAAQAQGALETQFKRRQSFTLLFVVCIQTDHGSLAAHSVC
jgi:hypothetical protein